MIYFDGNIHVYYNTDGVIYDSPSKVLARYKHKFDAEAVAKAYARKHGETPEYWIRTWEENRDRSLERGTGIHDSKEQLMLGRGLDKFQGKVVPVHNPDFTMDSRAIKNLIDLPDGVYPEIPIWNHAWRISGKLDKLILETINGRRWAHIEDFKTNKSIDKVSYQNRQGEYKRMLGPVGHLMDCSWVHYTLQLSFYQFIMEQAGFLVGERTLIHIPHPIRDDAGNILAQPADVLYKLPYMKPEICAILADYSKGRRLQYYKDIKQK